MQVTRKIHRPQPWSRRVLKLLIDRGLSIHQLANSIGTHRSMVSRAIHQRTYPSVIAKIEKELGMKRFVSPKAKALKQAGHS
ncbi:MAG: helix-turn-helix domain-containing protein [Akkermansiaceae bacterium]